MRFTTLSLLLTLLTAELDSQTLLRDHNTSPEFTITSSHPRIIAELASGEVLFNATTLAEGSEPWVTDGTDAGTRMLLDMTPGVEGAAILEAVLLPSGVTLFVGESPAFGRELWRTDGTTAGTQLVLDIQPGTAASSPLGLLVHGDCAYFFADDGVHGVELWRSNGTAAGTRLVEDVRPGARGSLRSNEATLAWLGGGLWFIAWNGSSHEVRTSDGITTRLAGPIVASLDRRPVSVTEFGDRVLFGMQGQGYTSYWVSDGTEDGTLPLGVEGVRGFEVAGPLAYFSGLQPGFQTAPFVTDGTLKGTRRLASVAPSPGSVSMEHPLFLGSFGALLIFQAGSASGSGIRLFATDGVTTTILATNVSAWTQGFDSKFGGFIYWGGSVSGQPGLCRTDGTVAGTGLVSSAYAEEVFASSSALYFNVYESPTGRELWTSDGTGNGTQLVRDLTPHPISAGSNPRIIGTHREQAIVQLFDPIDRFKTWITDGTATGTHLLIDEGGSSARMASTGEFLLFTVDDGNLARNPWISDGTLAGTRRLPIGASVPIFATTVGSARSTMMALGSRVLFSASSLASGEELWITDGTVAGSFELANIAPFGSSSPRNFYAWGDRIVFLASQSAQFPEPWITDGSVAGTSKLGIPTPQASQFYLDEFHGYRDHVYFAAGDGTTGSELWRSDGTQAGTGLFLELEPGTTGSQPADFLNVGDRLLFRATTGVLATDGTPAGTQVLVPTGAKLLRVSDDRALILSWNSGGNVITHVTDGTLGGTFLRPSLALQSPTNVWGANPTDDRLALLLDGPLGNEGWITDGLNETLIADIAPGDSFSNQWTRIGDKILFASDDGVHGAELFTLPATAFADESFGVFGYGCAGTGGLIPMIDVFGEADASASFSITLTDALASTLAFFTWAPTSGALPLPGCALWPGAGLHFATLTTDALGTAAVTAQPSPSLAGRRFVAQFFVLDPAGSAFGLASSTAGLDLFVGP